MTTVTVLSIDAWADGEDGWTRSPMLLTDLEGVKRALTERG